MYVTMKEIIDRAYQEGYGVPAVLGENETCIIAAIEAAEETKSPLIFINFVDTMPDPFFYCEMVKTYANQASVPVALCLDHSPDFADTIAGIQAGFSAVMIDRSKLSYEENRNQVKELTKIAHAVGVTVEAELGHVGSGGNYEEDGHSAFTEPEEAKRFVEETGVDCLAVAVGTAHGAYKGEPHIQFDRLKAIREAVPVPLVLHGGSGSGDENIRKACQNGIAKVNFARDIVQAAYDALKEADLEGDAMYDFFEIITKGIKEKVKHFFEVTGCVGKAWTLQPEFGVQKMGLQDEKEHEEK